MNPDKMTHFGFKAVPLEDKAHHVSQVFNSVAKNYDLMNDLMSLGIHRLWKRFALELAQAQRGHSVLDLAGGTGDLATQFARQVGTEGQVVLADMNIAMMQVGRQRLLNRGILVHYAQVNAEYLPFADNCFDIVSIAFGLRNVTGIKTGRTGDHTGVFPVTLCLTQTLLPAVYVYSITLIGPPGCSRCRQLSLFSRIHSNASGSRHFITVNANSRF